MDRTGFEPTTSCNKVKWLLCHKIAKQALYQAELPAQMILEQERLRFLRILCFFMKYFEAQAMRFKC